MEFEQHFLDTLKRQLSKQRDLAEAALAQVDDEHFFAPLDAHAPSLAVLVKHLAGNMRSRFTDFLTTDGDKEDRQRDGEFEIHEHETRESLEASWQHAWSLADQAVFTLSSHQLAQIITIRGEPHTVLQALMRHVGHLSYHVGQIVQLARHHSGEAWQTLSIAKGASEAFRLEMLRRHGAPVNREPVETAQTSSLQRGDSLPTKERE